MSPRNTASRGRVAPAFYALRSGGARDYVTLLHPPYTAWHLSYAVVGGCLAATVDWWVLGLTLLAFGLASQARLVLLDEPTNGLDIPSKSLLRRVITEALTPDRLFVISTHQVRDLGPLMDPIVILNKGRVLLNRTLAEIGAQLHMTQQSSPPAKDAPNLLFSEPTVGGFWSVWRGVSVTETGTRLPSRSTTRFTFVPTAVSATLRRNFCMSVTGWPSYSTMTSPRRRPARSAGWPFITSWITTP